MPSDVLRPVSTRSALLSLLPGAEVASLSPRDLVAGGALVGFSEAAVRTALSRMVAAGDVVRDEAGDYVLSARLKERQERTERAIHPPLRPWDGDWSQFVVTSSGRSAAARTELRTLLTNLRFGEFREGVWTRPANLAVELPAELADVGASFVARPDGDPAGLAARLWDLTGWAATARALLAAMETDDTVVRFTACVTSARHLLSDPVLPESLLPAGWPGEELRDAHLEYRAWVQRMRREAVGT